MISEITCIIGAETPRTFFECLIESNSVSGVVVLTASLLFMFIGWSLRFTPSIGLMMSGFFNSLIGIASMLLGYISVELVMIPIITLLVGIVLFMFESKG